MNENLKNNDFFSLIGFMLELIQVIGVDLGISVPALKLKKAMFGGCMVTNIGALGIRDAYAPFTRKI